MVGKDPRAMGIGTMRLVGPGVPNNTKQWLVATGEK